MLGGLDRISVMLEMGRVRTGNVREPLFHVLYTTHEHQPAYADQAA
jgi:hypothetical protein